MRQVTLAVAFLIALLVIPVPAHANAGVPVLALVWPVAWLALVPVTLLESLVARRHLALPFSRACSLVLGANLRSTFVGIPLAQALAFAVSAAVSAALPGAMAFSPDALSPLQLVWTAVGLMFVPWIEPRWGIEGIVITFAQIPAFFISVLIEYQYMKHRFPPEMCTRVKKWSWRANEVSYAVLVAGVLPFWAFRTPASVTRAIFVVVLGTTLVGVGWMFWLRRQEKRRSTA